MTNASTGQLLRPHERMRAPEHNGDDAPCSIAARGGQSSLPESENNGGPTRVQARASTPRVMRVGFARRGNRHAEDRPPRAEPPPMRRRIPRGQEKAPFDCTPRRQIGRKCQLCQMVATNHPAGPAPNDQPGAEPCASQATAWRIGAEHPRATVRSAEGRMMHVQHEGPISRTETSPRCSA